MDLQQIKEGLADPTHNDLIESAYSLALLPDECTDYLVKLLLNLRSDYELVIAGLLVKKWRIERSPELSMLILERFGQGVLNILKALDDLALIDQLHEQEKNDLEQLRKMLLAMASDMRAVILKLAIQTVLMRTMNTLPIKLQQQLAMQTQDIFAPLANRLGIAQLKWELEDRALRILEPDIYHEISHELEEKRVDRERYINRIIDTLKFELKRSEIPFNRVYGRVKHINSIYLKMKRKGLKFEQLNDVRAVRIEVNTEEECYQALAMVDSLWKSIPSEFDDYISNPKANGYQSLHGSFIGPEKRILEVQIRTTKMHENAELGVAAHWIYKEKGAKHSRQFEQQIEWLRRMISGGDKKRGDVVFDQFKNEAFRDRIYALSPHGKVIDLPEGSTPLDFAYHVHTQMGHCCRGAKVNGNIVPLTTALKNGDTVEILTQKEAQPSRDWLNEHLGYLQSGRARAKVKSFFKKLEKDSSISAGQEMLERECKRLAVDISHLDEVAQRFNQHSIQDLYAVIGCGDVGVLSVIHEITARQQKHEKVPTLNERLAKIPVKSGRQCSNRNNIEIEGIDDLLVNFATCCQAVPPIEIKGFITLGRGINIHRADCRNIQHLAKAHPERILDVNWSAGALGLFVVDVIIEAYDRAHILRDITNVLANEKIAITGVKMKQDEDFKRLSGTFSLEICDMEQLSRAMHRIGLIKNVENVRRVQH